jgi:acyl-CoA reductase-like NAD-dependent aldehyde dehydrogenase
VDDRILGKDHVEAARPEGQRTRRDLPDLDPIPGPRLLRPTPRGGADPPLDVDARHAPGPVVARERHGDRAVASTRCVFESGAWSGLHPSERKAVLGRLADLIMENRAELAVMEAVDAGKPVTD